MTQAADPLFADPLDPARAAGWIDPPARKGFFTDTSICIGCKACEVACKEWNHVPEDGMSLLGSSYDNTGALGASTWRHVAFIEQPTSMWSNAGANGLRSSPVPDGETSGTVSAATSPEVSDSAPAAGRPDFRWLMSSDVCKHCTSAGCLDVCPTGALFRTEFGTVVVQADICNGCGYCVPACPFGVIDRRRGEKGATPNLGMAQKCTLCYDRLQVGAEPACAKACPTQSIQFGDVVELRARAAQRVGVLHESGVASAQLYGHDPHNGVDGCGAMFLLLDEPEVYGLPPDPVVPTRALPEMWARAGLAAAALLVGALGAFTRRPR
jgi:formate dehydrogenase iron-sulfur subunit